jgi:tetratricopeptide (TPR) repeat protein
MRIPQAGRGVAIVLVLVAGMTAAAARAETTTDLRAEAFRLYDAGLYREALPYLDAVLSRKHRDIEARIKRGNVYLHLDQPAQARADFDTVIRFAPSFPSTYTDRGIADIMLGELDAARSDFSRAIALYGSPVGSIDLLGSNDPNSSWNLGGYAPPVSFDRWGQRRAIAHCGLGQVYHRMGQDEQAIAEYNRAIQLNPGDPNNYAGRGEAYAARDQLDPALADFNEAVRIDPGHVQGHRLRAASLSRLGQNENALADLDALIRANPTDAGALKNRGGVLVRMGKYEQAIKDLDEALELDPRRVSALLNRGAAYNELHQYERAITDLDEAIRLDPNHSAARTNRGLAQLALGRYERGIDDLSEAIRLDPKNAVAHFNRAEAYVRLGQLDRAVDDFDATTRLAPRFAPAFVGLGNALEQLGKTEQAIEEYSMALHLAPAAAGVYCNRGNARRLRGDWGGAIADYTTALGLDPRHADAHVARGWARLIAGRDGASDDASAYLSQRRGDDKYAAYMAILGALDARRTGHDAEAGAFLDLALANTAPSTWPAPILRYLHHTTTANALLAAAGDDAQTAEAHAFIGLDLLYSGFRAGAVEHLGWVRDHSPVATIALGLARETLQRIEGQENLPPALP